MTCWWALAQRRNTDAWSKAVAAAGGVLDQAELVVRTTLPANDITAGLVRLFSTGNIAWVAITSPHTLKALASVGWPVQRLLQETGAKLAAVGKATSRALAEGGLKVDLQPSVGLGGAALAAAFPPGTGSVLLPGAAELAGQLEPGLKAKGWTVEHLPVYQTTTASALPANITERWHDGGYRALVASAPSVVRAAIELLGPPGHPTASSASPLPLTQAMGPAVTLGRASTKAALEAGFSPVVEAAQASGEAVAAALVGIEPADKTRCLQTSQGRPKTAVPSFPPNPADGTTFANGPASS